MSTPLFLLAGLGSAIGLAALFHLIGLIVRSVSPSAGTLHRRWLERRLRRRLARGTDSYFEELRSIEAGMARESAPPAPARSPIQHLLFGTTFYLYGLFMLALFLPEDARPAWTRRPSGLIFVVLGLQYAGLSGGVDNPRRGTRIIGIVMVVLGALVFVYDLYHPLRAAP